MSYNIKYKLNYVFVRIKIIIYSNNVLKVLRVFLQLIIEITNLISK